MGKLPNRIKRRLTTPEKSILLLQRRKLLQKVQEQSQLIINIRQQSQHHHQQQLQQQEQQQQKSIIYPRLPFERPIPFTKEEQDEILQTATIPVNYPNYKISNIPELAPTRKYVIPNASYDAFAQTLFTGPSRIGNNATKSNNQEIYDNLVASITSQKKGNVSKSINIESAFSWGLVATKDIKAGECLIELSLDTIINFFTTFIPPSNCDEIIQSTGILLKQQEALDKIEIINNVFDFTAQSSFNRLIDSGNPHLRFYAIQVLGLTTHYFLGPFSQHYAYIQSLPTCDRAQIIGDPQSFHKILTKRYLDKPIMEDDDDQTNFPTDVREFADVLCKVDIPLEMFRSLPSRDIVTVFCSLLQPFQPPGQIITSHIFIEQFYTCIALYHTRAYGYPKLPKHSGSSNPYLFARRNLADLLDKVSYMAPLVDLPNHSPTPNAFLVDDDPKPNDKFPIRLRSKRAIKAGESICIAYNERPDIDKIYHTIMSKKESDICTTITSSLSSKSLFNASIIRVPELMDMAKAKTLFFH